MLNANTIIDGIFAIAQRNYDSEDPMRWPYRVGMLESKIRELVYILNYQEQKINEIKTKLEEQNGNDI